MWSPWGVGQWGEALTSKVAAVGIIAMLASGVVAFGEGFDPREVLLGDGAAWVTSEHRGEIVHVNGTSGSIDWRASLPEEYRDDELSVVQNRMGTWLVDETRGIIWSLDPVTLALGEPRELAPDNVRVVAAGADLYEVATNRVTQLDPVSLDIVGQPVQLGDVEVGEVAGAADGRLLVTTDAGRYVVVEEGVEVGGGGLPGPSVLVTATADGPALLDLDTRQVHDVDESNGLTRRGDPVEVATPILMDPSSTSAVVWVAERETGRVVGVEPGGEQVAFDLDRALAPPLLAGPDTVTVVGVGGDVTVIDLDGEVTAELDMDCGDIVDEGGDVDGVERDGVVILNRTRGDCVVVSRPGGTADEVDKSIPGAPESDLGTGDAEVELAAPPPDVVEAAPTQRPAAGRGPDAPVQGQDEPESLPTELPSELPVELPTDQVDGLPGPPDDVRPPGSDRDDQGADASDEPVRPTPAPGDEPAPQGQDEGEPGGLATEEPDDTPGQDTPGGGPAVPAPDPAGTDSPTEAPSTAAPLPELDPYERQPGTPGGTSPEAGVVELDWAWDGIAPQTTWEVEWTQVEDPSSTGAVEVRRRGSDTVTVRDLPSAVLTLRVRLVGGAPGEGPGPWSEASDPIDASGADTTPSPSPTTPAPAPTTPTPAPTVPAPEPTTSPLLVVPSRPTVETEPGAATIYWDFAASSPDEWEIEMVVPGVFTVSNTRSASEAPPARFTGLQNDPGHSARVRGLFDGVPGAWSPWSADFTPGDSSSSGTFATNATPGDGQVTFDWPGYSGEQFDLQVERAGGAGDIYELPPGQLQHTIPATNGVQYRGRVRHNGSSGGVGTWGSWSAYVVPLGYPAPPSDVSFVRRTSQQDVQVNFSPSSDGGGGTITGYEARFDGSTYPISGPGDSFRPPDITRGSLELRTIASYDGQVRYSSWVAGQDTPAAPPGAPTLGAPQRIDPTTVRVDGSASGGPVDQYRFRSGPTPGSGTWSQPAAVSGSRDFSFQVRGGAGETVHYEAQVSNAAGWSPSASGSMQNPAPAPQPTVRVGKGGSAQGQPGCSSEFCRYVQVDVADMAAPYDVQVYSTYRGGVEEPDGRFFRYSTSERSSARAYFGYPGETVWVVVNGVRSNDITW